MVHKYANLYNRIDRTELCMMCVEKVSVCLFFPLHAICGISDNFDSLLAQISFPDLGNYDSALAWPLILDNFVEWMRQKHS